MTEENPSHSPLCPICQQGPLNTTTYNCVDYLSKQNFTLLKCLDCSCYITQIGQQQATTTDYYGEEYYNSKVGKFSPLIENIFRFNHKRNANFFYKSFSPKAVLDYGCGRGYVLEELKKLGCDVVCLESETAAEWIINNNKMNVIVPTKTFENNLQVKPESFQLIIFWHVFEHLADPVATLKQVTQWLEKDKFLCISVPNIDSFQARLGLKTWFHLDVPRHLFHFSKTGLIKLLEANGYEVVQVRSGGIIQNLYGWFQSLANLFTPFAINSLYRFLQGGKAKQRINTLSLFIQILTVPIWMPLGILGYVIEETTGNYGTITIYTKKNAIKVAKSHKNSFIPNHKNFQ